MPSHSDSSRHGLPQANAQHARDTTAAAAAVAAGSSSSSLQRRAAGDAVTERAMVTSRGHLSGPATRNTSSSSRRHKQPRQSAASASAAGLQPLLSFPVEDLEPFQEDNTVAAAAAPWESQAPGCGTAGRFQQTAGGLRSWPMQDDGDEDPHSPTAAADDAAAGSRACMYSPSRSRDARAGGDGRNSSGRGSVYASTHAAVQAMASGAACLLQQLAVPWGGLMGQEGVLQQQQQQRGEPARCWSQRGSGLWAMPSGRGIRAAVTQPTEPNY
jgi:hypothetical protein